MDEDEDWLLARELAHMAAGNAGELCEIDRLRSGLYKPVCEGSSMTTRAVCYAKFMQKVRRHCPAVLAKEGWQHMRTGSASINSIWVNLQRRRHVLCLSVPPNATFRQLAIAIS